MRQIPNFVYLESYGCSANQNNTEIMKGLIIQAGLQLTENPEIADILIINTCIVKGPTENKMKGRIFQLEKFKKPIIIAGCMPEVRKKELIEKNLYLLGISHVKDILKLIRNIIEKKYDENEFLQRKKEVKLNLSKISQNKKIGITQISEGCLGNCNFCVTKIAKGNLFSYPEEEIIENIKKDLESGCKEIWLTSQDNAAYGFDSGTSIVELLKKIQAIDSSFKIRLGMMNPNNILPILDELIECYKHEKIYKFLHIPIQSGSNRVLKAMNRQYQVNDFLKIINKFKKEIPDVTLSTDIIAAYPEETEEEHKETLEVINKIRPDVMNIARYWPMKCTKAAREKQIDSKIARKRTSEIQKLHLKIALENNQKLVGKKFKVFVNEQAGTNCLARNDNYKLIVIKSKENLLGKFVNVEIKQSFSHYLIG